MTEAAPKKRAPRKKAAPKKIVETAKQKWDRMKEENHAAQAKRREANDAIRREHNLAMGGQIPEHLRPQPEGAPNPNFKGGRRNRRAWGIRRGAKAGFRWRNGGGRMHIDNPPWTPEPAPVDESRVGR